MNSKFIVAILFGIHATSAATTCLQQYCQNSCLVTLSDDTDTCLSQTDVNDISGVPGSEVCNAMNLMYGPSDVEDLIEADASVAEASCSVTAQSCGTGYEKESGDGTTCILSCSGLEENWNQDCSCNPDTAECVELKNTHAQQCSGQC